MIPRERVEERLAILKRSLEQQRADLNATLGAIKVCELLLEPVKPEETEKK